jgi:hypothetical protein
MEKTNNEIIFEKMTEDLNEIIHLFGAFASKYEQYAPSFTIVIDPLYDELRTMEDYFEAEIDAFDMGVSLNLNTNLERDWE